MDMLSLFEFKYTIEPNSTNGKFEIINYHKALKGIFNSGDYKNWGYVRPDIVLAIDNSVQLSKKKSGKPLFQALEAEI